MLAAAALFALLGCEQAEKTSSQDEGLILFDPPAAEISGVGATVVFSVALDTNAVARELVLYLPLDWSVSDAALGSIRSTANFTAIYESTGLAGNNIIRVQDQRGSEGTTVVVQR
jgi:hypothetical protein